MAATLRTPVNDVPSLARILRDEYGFTDVKQILNGQATRAGILKALADVRDSRLGQTDNLLIYYAGHGFQRPEPRTSSGFLPTAPR